MSDIHPEAKKINLDRYANGEGIFLKNPINVSGVYDQIGNEEFGNSWAEMLKGEKNSVYNKDITKEAGQSLRDAMSGLIDVWNFREAALDPDGKFDKATLLGMYSPIRLGNSRVAYQSLGRAVEVILRERSGAAVPPEELKNYRVLYGPNFIDLATENQKSAYMKLNSLDSFFTRTIELFGQGRLDSERLIKDLKTEWKKGDFEKTGAKSSSILSDGRELIKSNGKYYIAPVSVENVPSEEISEELSSELTRQFLEEQKPDVPQESGPRLYIE